MIINIRLSIITHAGAAFNGKLTNFVPIIDIDRRT